MAEAIATPRAAQEARWNAVRSALQWQRGAPPVVPAAAGEAAPASFTQQRLWFLEQLAPGTAQHNLSIACALLGPLHVPALEQAMAGMLQRHAVLRTGLCWQDDVLVQRIHDTTEFALPVTRVNSPTEASALLDAAAALPFDLQQPALLRARLLQLAPEEHWLSLTFHHLAFDGWSFEIFMGELGALYGALRAGDSSPLAPLALQYADYAAWQRRWMNADTLAPQLRFWRERLAGSLPVLRLPADRPRSSLAARRGASLAFALDPRLSQALRRLAAAEAATPFTLFLAAFQVLLYRHTGDDDMVVGTPVAQRARPELASMVGPLLNMLALRADLSGAPRFREFLARTNAATLEALANQELPFEQLVDALDLARRPDAAPLVQAMFTYQNLPASGWSLPGLQARTWNVHSGAAAFEASLSMWEKDGVVGGQLDYDAGVFDQARMRQLLDCYRALLQSIANGPDTRIDCLALVPDSAMQALRNWNATATPYPRNATLHALFEQQAGRTPHATALAWSGRLLSYAALDERANALAQVLRQAGVARGSLVALRLPSGCAFVVAALATLKTGAAYLPLAADEPVARVAAGLRGSALACVVAATAAESLSHATGAAIVVVDAQGTGLLACVPTASAIRATQSDIACVMFTSGSTGTPRGVRVPHRGIVRLVQGQNYADLGPRDVLLQLAPVTFDAANFEIWGALLNGATLAFPGARQPTLADIGAAIRDYGVTTLWLTAGLFEAMVDQQLADLAACRQLLVGGDVVSLPQALRFLREAPSCRLVNCYGPTENSTFSTFCPLSLELLEVAAGVPIGRPVSNTQLWVLDPLGTPVPPGVVGEAWLAGDGVMRGYLQDSQADAGCLAPDPFGGQAGALMYRSGDRVRMRCDGQLEFIGRIDRQLKLRGFRVEPGECEQVLAASPLVRSVAVVAQAGAAGLQLVAHVVASPDAPVPALAQLEACLREHVQALLPMQLRPAAWVFHAALPLDANGKIDRRALQAHVPRVEVGPTPVLPPTADAIESLVAGAFAQVLGRPDVDPQASFFDQGGHSLLALRLISLLEQAMETRMPLALLFQHTSVAALATALRTAQTATLAGGPSLVELRVGPRSRPLFVVPGGRGGMAEMALYARFLASSTVPFAAWGLPARGLGGDEPPHACVRDMARDYLAQVRRIQPAGPWLIAGECVGGVIAHEMVRQLCDEGGDASLLLLDSWCPTGGRERSYRLVQRPLTLMRERWPLRRAAWADLLAVLRQHLRDLPTVPARKLPRHAGAVARTLLRVALAWRSRILQVGRAEAGAHAAFAIGENYIAVTMRHRPRAGTMRAALLVSAHNQRLGLPRDWKRLLPGLTVLTAPGNHDTYLRDTPAAAAAGLAACIAALESAPSIKDARP